jgi:acyl-coenzyme A thioesterase PaaI-like protein
VATLNRMGIEICGVNDVSWNGADRSGPGPSDATRNGHGRMPAIDALCLRSGAVRPGALVALADSVAGFHAVPLLHPALPVTSELSFRATAATASSGWVSASSQVLRRRRHGAVLAVDLHDGGDTGRSLGRCILTFSGLTPREPVTDDRFVAPLPTAPLCTSLSELIAPQLEESLELVLAIEPGARNGLGAFSGAVTAMLVEAAAESRASAILDAPCEVTAMVIHFLDAGRIGPVRARCEVSRVSDRFACVDVTLTDSGSQDRVMATATAWAALPDASRTP